MSTNLDIVSNLDQPIPLTKEEKLFKQIDSILENSIQEKNPMIAFDGAKNMLGIARISGIALAKFLWTIHARWGDYNTEDDFRDVCMDELGLTKNTTDRYVAVWEMFSGRNIPKDYYPEVRTRPMRDLVKIAAVVKQGYTVKTEDWAQIAHAADGAELDRVLRSIKGAPPRKSSLQIYLERNGDLNVWYQGKTHYVGYLKLDDSEPDVQKAIERIKHGAGLTER